MCMKLSAKTCTYIYPICIYHTVKHILYKVQKIQVGYKTFCVICISLMKRWYRLNPVTMRATQMKIQFQKYF